MKQQKIKGASTEEFEIVLSRYEYDRMVAENKQIRAELRAATDTLHEEIDEIQEFIDKLWKAIILDHKPDYGDWAYPDEAYRHIVAEVSELRSKSPEPTSTPSDPPPIPGG